MLSIRDLNFSYKSKQSILKHISFEVNSKEKVCVLGESGSGKSTLLKLIYAELQADSGKISFNQKEIKGPNFQLIPGHDEIKYVPQDFQLEQYIPVKQIVGKFLSNIDANYKNNRVSEVLKALSIENLAEKKSHELSGGQKQRVAIAKAIAKPPKLLLLDEPFSQLDSALHIFIREQLMQYLTENQIAVLFTSHRSDDALGYSDQIILMRDGEIIQKGRPQEVYELPANPYVCGMFGEVNFLNREESHLFQIPPNYFKNIVAIYPEEIKINEKGKFKGVVKFNRYQGSRYLIYIKHKELLLKTYAKNRLEVDSKIKFDIKNHRWIG